MYFSYGIHSLLNAVAEPEGEAAAVLIRALEPRWGVEEMRERRGRDAVRELCSGPGKLTEALGVGLEDNGRSLLEPPFEVRAADARRAGGRGDDGAAGRDHEGRGSPVALLRLRQPVPLAAGAVRGGGHSGAGHGVSKLRSA